MMLPRSSSILVPRREARSLSSDRGAISMAGHSGMAYWFSKASGEFVTSNYYLDYYPDWVQDWNGKQHPKRYAGTNWELMHKQANYVFGNSDDREQTFLAVAMDYTYRDNRLRIVSDIPSALSDENDRLQPSLSI